MKALGKITASLLALGLGAIFLIDHLVYSGKGANLKFVNSSGQVVSSARVSVAGKFCAVKELSEGGEFDCYFENLYDSSYSVSVTLENGAIYSEESLGYVTGGFDFNHTITINQSGVIALEPSPNT